MAGSRRGGPPDLKGTLGTLIRTTLYQVGAMKDAAVRQAQSQRSWFDGAVLERKRKDALAALGEAIYQRASTGELGPLEDDREVVDLMAEVADLDRRLAEAHADEDDGTVSSADWAAPSERQRFHRAGGGRRAEEVRVWRPVMPPDEPGDEPADAHADEPGGPAPRAARADDGPSAAAAEPARGRRTRRAPVGGGARRGGIAFVDDGVGSPDDDDLSEYMHEDDVPKR